MKSVLILVQLSFHLSGRWFAIKRKDNPLSLWVLNCQGEACSWLEGKAEDLHLKKKKINCQLVSCHQSEIHHKFVHGQRDQVPRRICSGIWRLPIYLQEISLSPVWIYSDWVSYLCQLFGDRCPCYKKQIGTNWVPLLASWQERETIALFRKLHINWKGTPVLDVLDLSCCFLFVSGIWFMVVLSVAIFTSILSCICPWYTDTHSLMTMENSLKNSMLMTGLLFCSSEILN